MVQGNVDIVDAEGKTTTVPSPRCAAAAARLRNPTVTELTEKNNFQS
jgi:hypothetical protein